MEEDKAWYRRRETVRQKFHRETSRNHGVFIGESSKGIGWRWTKFKTGSERI